jgi:AraC-like DNA-binding protein
MARNSQSFDYRNPAIALSPWVDMLWSYEGYAPPHARERLLPTGTMSLVFKRDLEGRTASNVAGPRSEFSLLETSRPFSIIGVHFRPGGGHPFFGMPCGELHNLAVPLDMLWGHSAASVTDRLWETNVADERLRIVEQALIERLRGSTNRHPAVDYALRRFTDSNGRCPVSEVVRRVALSERRFVDVFRSAVGLSPKLFCRIRRFNEALRQIEQMADVDWLNVSLCCGYFDQAHFNHDFHTFSGINPSTYIRHRTSRTHVVVTD